MTFDAWFPHMMPMVPGCPEPFAVRALIDAATEFCERTRLWRDVDSFLAAPGIAPYTITTPVDSVLVEIDRLDFDGRRLDPITAQALDDCVPDWRETAGGEGQPRYFIQLAIDEVRIVPEGNGPVKVWTVIKPAPEAQALPSFLYTHYRLPVTAGALARLMIMPGKAWTNMDLATVNSAVFGEAIGRANVDAVRGQQRAPMRTKASYF